MVIQEDMVGNGGASKEGKGRDEEDGGGGGGAQATTKSSRLLHPPINIQQATNNCDHGGWEMEGCAREVRG
jgi:hypothetical protein